MTFGLDLNLGLYGRQAGGTPAFDPTDYSLLTYNKTDAASVGSVGDGNDVTTWTDSIFGAATATQATSGSRPDYEILGGEGVLNFDGSDDRMSFASELDFRDVTIWGVFKPTSTGHNMILGHSTANRQIRISTGNLLAFNGQQINTTGSPVTLDEWSSVCLSMRKFVDGVQTKVERVWVNSVEETLSGGLLDTDFQIDTIGDSPASGSGLEFQGGLGPVASMVTTTMLADPDIMTNMNTYFTNLASALNAAEGA